MNKIIFKILIFFVRDIKGVEIIKIFINMWVNREGILGDIDLSMKIKYFIEFYGWGVLIRICEVWILWEMEVKIVILVMV